MEISNNSGLTFSFLEDGNVQNIDADKIRINLKAGNLYAQPGTQLYLRWHKSGSIEYVPVLGAVNGNKISISEGELFVQGAWKGLQYVCRLQLSEKSTSWRWHIDITNTTSDKALLDVIWKQEVGLKSLNDGLVNEYYVAQYLERTLLTDAEYGTVAACRQNIKEAGGFPWLMMASAGNALTGLTDGMQFYGNSCWGSGIPECLLQKELPGNMAGE